MCNCPRPTSLRTHSLLEAAAGVHEQGVHGLAALLDLAHDGFVAELGVTAVLFVADDEHGAHVGVLGQADEGPGDGAAVFGVAAVLVGLNVEPGPGHQLGQEHGQVGGPASIGHDERVVADAYQTIRADVSLEFHALLPSMSPRPRLPSTLWM
jgi:hypothetical protein